MPQNATPSPPTADAAGPPRRRATVRRIAMALGLVVAAVVALFFYVTSDDALRRLWIPLASRALEAHVEAETLEWQFPATLRLERGRIYREAEGLEVDMEDVRIVLTPASLFSPSSLRIPELEVARLAITVTTPSAPTEAAPEPAAAGPRRKPWVPVVIERARIGRFQFRGVTEGESWLDASSGPVELDHLDPDQTAALTTRFELRFVPPASGRVFRVSGDVEAKLEQREDGRLLEWDVEMPLQLTEVPETLTEDELLTFAVAQEVRGTLDAEGRLTVDFETQASRGAVPAGSLTGKLEIGRIVANGAGPERRPVHVTAQGEGLRPALINPFLAVMGPESLETGQFGGHVDLRISGDEVAIDSDISGVGLRLAAGPDHTATPPVDLQVVQQATLHRAAELLRIEKCSVRVRDERRVLVRADLTAPLHFAFGEDDSTAGSSRTPSRTAAPPSNPMEKSAKLTFAIDKVEIEQLRPWAAAWGSTVLQSTQAGFVSANFAAEVDPSARAVGVRGTLLASQLTVKTGLEGSLSSPLNVQMVMAGRSPDLAQFTVESLAATIDAGEAPLATLDAAGAFDRDRGKLQTRMTLKSGDVTAGLGHLGLLSDESRVQVSHGELEAGLSLERGETGESVRAKGTLDLKGVSLETQEARINRSAVATFSGRVPADSGRIEGIEVKLNAVDEAGGAGGDLRAEGYWPLRFEEPRAVERKGASAPGATGEQAGRVALRLRNLDLRPWLELFGYREDTPGRPRWPASADLTLTVDSAGEEFTLEGEERVGPLGAPDSGAAETAAPAAHADDGTSVPD